MTVLDSLTVLMLRLERYAVEVFLSVSSFGAAVALWRAPNDFHIAYGRYFHLLADLIDNTDAWAVLTLAAAILKAAGLVACINHRPGIGLPLRCAGLALSGIFWALAGLSSLTVSSVTIGGIPMLLMGVSSWWLLLRFPSTPERDR